MEQLPQDTDQYYQAVYNLVDECLLSPECPCENCQSYEGGEYADR